MIIIFIRKHLMNAYTSIPMLVCLLFVTWSSYGGHSANSVKLSGEEMFRGVFFAEGQFAELIPELKATQTMYSSNQLSVNEKKALALARTQIIASIKASNPHYFEDFKANIQTANPVLIKEKLMEGQRIVTKNALRLFNLKEPELKSFNNFLAKDGKNVETKVLNQLTRKSLKEGFSNTKANNGTGTCVVIDCVWVMYYNLALMVIGAEMTSNSIKSSKLMLEQVVCSICTIAPQVG